MTERQSQRGERHARRAIGTRRAYGLVLVATGGYTCLMFVWFSLPAYLPTIIEEMALSSTQAGIVAGAVPVTYIPLALLSGLVVDRVGPGRSLAVGVVLYGVAQVARSAASGFPSLLAATLVVGVGATAVTFGLPKLVSTLFPAERTGFPSSIYLVGASAGTASAFGVGRPILGPLLGGWRSLFFWSGLVAIAYGVLWFAVARRAGVDRRVSDGESTFAIDSMRRDLAVILSHRDLQLLVIVGTMYLLVSHGLQGWLPTILESRGLSSDRAGWTTSLLVVAVAGGIFTVPTVADRLDARRLALAVCGSLVCLGVAGVLVGGLGLLLLCGVLCAGFGVGGLSPLLRALPPDFEDVGARLTGTAVGFVFAVGEIGGFVGPVLVGTLHDATGSYAPGLGVLAAAGLVVVGAGGALRRRH